MLIHSNIKRINLSKIIASNSRTKKALTSQVISEWVARKKVLYSVVTPVT